MALALTLSSLTEDLKHVIKKLCIAKPNKSQYNDDPQPITCFAVNPEEDTVYVPLGIWRELLDDFPVFDHFSKTKVVCYREPYTLETDPKGWRDQNVVFEEGVARLEIEHSVFIAASTGYGKTASGTFFTAHFKLKTAVISHISLVNKQWADDFRENTNAKVQIVEGKKPLDPAADVYIIGVQKAASLSREALTDIGLVIFDEAHIATIAAFSKSLLRFQPKYVIGFSATPRRSDGMHKLLSMYFGLPKSFITRQQIKDFTVYKVETNFRPEIKYVMVKGAMVPDWNGIINSIEYNNARQDFIVSLVLKHPEHRILVLSGRKEQSKAIYDKILASEEKSVRLLIGKKKIKGEGTPPRITVAGTKKAGTGFDDPTLTMLILASDCKHVEQWEGRIRTSDNIIYDLVDDYSAFENHWKIRNAWYVNKGAVVKVISQRQRNRALEMPSKRLLQPNTNNR